MPYDGISNFMKPLGFIRAIDVAEEIGRSGSIIEEFGEGKEVGNGCQYKKGICSNGLYYN